MNTFNNMHDEVSELINEVLNNNYSSQEIEETFDVVNLLLESISEGDIKKYLDIYTKNKDIKSKIKDIESKRKEISDDFDNELKKVMAISDKTERMKAIRKINLNMLNGIRTSVSDEIADAGSEDVIDYDNVDLCKGMIAFQMYEFKEFTNKILYQFKQTSNEKFTQKFDITTGQNIRETLKDYLSKVSDIFEKLDNEVGEFIIDVLKYFKIETIITVSDKKLELNEDGLVKYMEDNHMKKSKEDSSEPEVQTEKETKKDITDTISDNKDLLTPLAKEANVTADQLSKIITKLCKTKKGNARKLDSGVITGLSIMICGILLTVKKNGKKDKQAIISIVNRLNDIITQKKSLNKILEFREFIQNMD